LKPLHGFAQPARRQIEGTSFLCARQPDPQKGFSGARMESLTRLVTESLARHGFDRPLDYRRLRWSRWFRCESHHSLLLVPSKPGVFALAEEIVDFGAGEAHVGTAALGCSAEQGSARIMSDSIVSGAARQDLPATTSPAPRRMLAVTQFFEADDMAFVLDRMLARQNPLRDALNSGRYFIRFVIIDDASQRSSVWNSLHQWLADASEKATGLTPETASGIASHFAASLELTPATEYVPAPQTSLFENTGVGRTLLSANASSGKNLPSPSESNKSAPIAAQQFDSGAATNIHCPSPLPSGF
jgi:hypothetical protein